jgi:solute carrier family 35 (UDP-galactose transporter), member B1
MHGLAERAIDSNLIVFVSIGILSFQFKFSLRAASLYQSCSWALSWVKYVVRLWKLRRVDQESHVVRCLASKKYPARKYINVCMIVTGVALFMGFGDKRKKEGAVDSAENMSSSGQLIGIFLLFVSLCFDGGTGAYEDKLMSVHQVQPFDLMFNIQLGKTILAGIGLLVFNQLHIFIQMVQEMGFLLVGLGFTGALGQVFIFVTIAKFGALTCSIIGLARKVTTLVASIYFYGHSLNSIQMAGLALSIASMVMDFMGKQKKGGGHGHHGGPPQPSAPTPEELEKILGSEDDDDEESGDVELMAKKP